MIILEYKRYLTTADYYCENFIEHATSQIL